MRFQKWVLYKISCNVGPLGSRKQVELEIYCLLDNGVLTRSMFTYQIDVQRQIYAYQMDINQQPDLCRPDQIVDSPASPSQILGVRNWWIAHRQRERDWQQRQFTCCFYIECTQTCFALKLPRKPGILIVYNAYFPPSCSPNSENSACQHLNTCPLVVGIIQKYNLDFCEVARGLPIYS